MVFKQLCIDYIKQNKTLFWSYMVIASVFYIVKIIVTSLVYSNIMDIEKHGFMKVIKQIFFLWMLIGVIYIVKMKYENIWFTEFLSFSRNRLLQIFLEKNKTNFKDANVSTDILRILEVTRYMRELFGWIIQTIIPIIIVTFIVNIFFLYKAPTLGCVNILCNVTLYIYIKNNYEKLIDQSNLRENKYIDMVQKIDEKFNNLLNIYLNNQVEETLKDNEKIEAEYTTIYKNTNQKVMNFTSMFKTIVYGFAIVSLYLLYYQQTKSQNNTQSNSQSNTGEDKTKNFVTILFIFTFYISTLENLSEDIPMYIMIIGNILNAEPFLEKAIFNETREQYLPNFQGNIKIDNISFRYSEENDYIFKDFSLDIPKGKRIGIIGQTGKGKSTLMKLLLNLYTLESGSIYLDGINLKEINIDDIRKNINYNNQKTNLFNDTILNNMKYGNNATDEQIIKLLYTYDLMSIFDRIDLHSTLVEKNGSNISLGMQKVIFLIRGILKDCKVFIFDEPFSGIDKNTRLNVLKMIDKETKGKTVIVITHDIDGFDQILDEFIEL